jgi:hypothetical protein
MRFGSEIAVPSYHYCNDNEGLYEYKTISEEITVGNGNGTIAKKVGKLRCGILQKNGEKLIVTLENVNTFRNCG